MTAELIHGDCIEQMAAMHAAGRTVDAICTDPPYHLTNVVPDVKWCVDCKRVLGGRDGNPAACPKCGGALQFQRSAGKKGFMSKEWDGGDIAFRPETWRLAYDLLPPGGHIAVFGGSRTHHRLMCAIEDAGFTIFDVCMFLFGTGFPKSRSLLKPAYEPIVLARKPGPLRPLNIDACRVPTDEVLTGGTGTVGKHEGWDRPYMHDGKPRANYRSTAGRWPPNILHSGDPEVLDAFARFGERKSGARSDKGSRQRQMGFGMTGGNCEASEGSAARFFPALGYGDDDLRFCYAAKASKRERCGSKHPTIKPLSVCRWLCRLITPPNGTVLDPFAGSGTTLHAAALEGFHAVGIEREEEYYRDARRRLGLDFSPRTKLRLAEEAAD